MAGGGPDRCRFNNALARVDDLRLDQLGVHRLEVRSADGRLVARGNPVRVEAAPQRLVLWGEIHGHTAFAEGQGSPRAFFDLRDARMLASTSPRSASTTSGSTTPNGASSSG